MCGPSPLDVVFCLFGGGRGLEGRCVLLGLRWARHSQRGTGERVEGARGRLLDSPCIPRRCPVHRRKGSPVLSLLVGPSDPFT